MTPTPTLRARLFATLGVAVAAAAIAWVKIQQNGAQQDFGYLWTAARAVLDGLDPYAVVRPGVTYFDNYLMYPLPPVLAVVPVASLSMNVAGILFSAAGMATLAFALSRDGWHRLPILMSFPALWAMTAGQVSPFVAAAAVAPAYAWAATFKPTLGLAAFVSRPSWRFIAIAAAVCALALVVQWDWPIRWLTVSRQTAAINYQVPIAVQGGGLLLLAALRWRRDDARLLLAMSCLPQSMMLYDQLPLLLIARTRMQAIVFSLWSYGAPLAMRFVTETPIMDTKQYTLPYLARIITWTLYLPALAVVLSRPNVGPIPPWLERRVAGLPTWLRGQPVG